MNGPGTPPLDPAVAVAKFYDEHPPRPWKCPVCGGCGHVPVNFYTGNTQSSSTTPVTCKACGGRGVMIV